MIICSECHEECTAVDVDFGIGAYEYWGAPGFDSNVQTVSNCCEADFEETDEDDGEIGEECEVSIGGGHIDDEPPF